MRRRVETTTMESIRTNLTQVAIVQNVSVEWLLEQAMEDIKSMSIEKYTTERLANGLVGWKHPMFTTFYKQQEEQDAHVKHPIEVEEGVLSCYACKSNRVFSTTMQTRAADEPMTTIAQCSQCHVKWTQN